MIVDSHVHVSEMVPGAADGQLDAAGLLRLMDEAGVQRAVLVHGWPSYDNAYSADSAKARPDRFASVCWVDAMAPAAADTVEYWLRERGMAGLRLFDATMPTEPRLDDPRTEALLKRAVHLAVPVLLVLRHDRIPAVRPVLERFSDLNFIIDHLARYPTDEKPPYDNSEAFFALAELPHVSLKFSTVNQWAIRKAAVAESEYLKAIVDRYGPSRLMWGSNRPVTRYKPYAEQVSMGSEPFAFLDDDERAAIMGGNALRCFWPTAKLDQ